MTTAIEETLGQEFWTQPENVLSEVFNLMYSQSIQVLREEIRERNGGVVDYMLIERMAFIYAFMRQREAAGDIADRNRREMLKDWLELAIQMKKLWSAEDRDNMADILLRKVNKAVFEAVKDLPTNQGAQVQHALAESFANQGL